MRTKVITLCIFLLFNVSCAKNDSEMSSEPAGKFEAGVKLTDIQMKPFSSCSVESLAQSLKPKCSVVSSTLQSPHDEIFTGIYTFTASDEEVTSVRFQRVVKAEVVCQDLNDQWVSKGMAKQTTTVIYASKEKKDLELSSCNEATPVWIKTKVELDSGEVLEESTQQLLETF